MSQILESRPKESLLIQDIVFDSRKSSVKSLAEPAVCYVCNKGLESGHSVTAKYTSNKIRFFCDRHFSN